jgi:hypothetical protein
LAEGGVVFAVGDEVLDFGGDVEDAETGLEGVNRFVDVLADSAGVEEGFFLRSGGDRGRRRGRRRGDEGNQYEVEGGKE